MRKYKNKKEVTIDLLLDGPLHEVVEGLLKAAEGLDDPEIVRRPGWSSDDFVLYGWRDMTPLERERADRKALAGKRAAQKKKQLAEERERATYEKLKAKFEEAE